MEVADHAIALMLTLMKGIEFHTVAVAREPAWQLASGVESLRPAVVGLYVRRGRHRQHRYRSGTARRKRSAWTLCFTIRTSATASILRWVYAASNSLDELMRQCDVVSVHVPLADRHAKLVGASAFAAAKPGLIMVNTARGEVIDLDALYRCDARRQSAGRRSRRVAGRAGRPEPSVDQGVQRERRLDRAPAGDDAAFGILHAGKRVRHACEERAEVAATFLRDGRMQNCVNGQFLKRDT